jgi:hypothetical protein
LRLSLLRRIRLNQNIAKPQQISLYLWFYTAALYGPEATAGNQSALYGASRQGAAVATEPVPLAFADNVDFMLAPSTYGLVLTKEEIAVIVQALAVNGESGSAAWAGRPGTPSDADRFVNALGFDDLAHFQQDANKPEYVLALDQRAALMIGHAVKPGLNTPTFEGAATVLEKMEVSVPESWQLWHDISNW